LGLGKGEPAPIFTQFIECVWQIAQQHPTAFEFNESYLIALLEATTSGRFGTFAFNSLAERVSVQQQRASARLPSVWVWLRQQWRSFLNPLYNPIVPGCADVLNVSRHSNCPCSVLPPLPVGAPSIVSSTAAQEPPSPDISISADTDDFFGEDMVVPESVASADAAEAEVLPDPSLLHHILSDGARPVHRLEVNTAAVRFWHSYFLRHIRAAADPQVASPLFRYTLALCGCFVGCGS
jgi:hypothetical protein